MLTNKISYEDVAKHFAKARFPERGKPVMSWEKKFKEDDTYGDMYFNKTLNDWTKFKINDRTKYDASISSGLAIMACNRNMYKPVANIKRDKINLGFARYANNGANSKIIR
jgi:hypothetical protein